MNYLPSIGLEVHVQLDTQTKMFCACRTDFGAEPNTNICPVCLGYPGALPVMNREAIRLTVITGMMLECSVSRFSKFDRKNYFYPDMPKNYQISQYDMPLCLGGGLDIECNGVSSRVGLTRIHLEEDVAKSIHAGKTSGIDFNRAGHPLMEIVTEPDMHSPEEVFEFLSCLKQILLYGGISQCNLEEGNIRCDVNCSLCLEDGEGLGTKAEIKNMNTFKGIYNALQYEIDRQRDVLSSGAAVKQETRRWDADAGITEVMRSKEEEHDYRYFPDPDLMPVALGENDLDSWKEQIPELPRQRVERMISEYDIPPYDSKVISGDKALADFFEECAGLSENPKAVSNWVMTELLRMLSEREVDISDAALTPQALAGLVKLIDSGVLNSNSAKQVFAVIFEREVSPEQVVDELGLKQVSDTGELESLVDRALEENPKSVEDYRGGKKAALKFLMGQVMRMSKGKANPPLIQEMLKKKLG